MLPPSDLNITPQQRRNLAKLIIFCHEEKTKVEFNIKRFATEKVGSSNSRIELCYPSQIHNECGTSACFCGMGPLAGIKPEREHESWLQYAVRCFTGEAFGSDNVWNLLFHENHSNDLHSAVLRGAFFLQHGIPPYNYHDFDETTFEDNYLQFWEAPTSFSPDWKGIKLITTEKDDLQTNNLGNQP